MIPKIIHYCWLSDNPIPEKLQKCMRTWKDKLPDYEFILWDAKRFDITSILWVKQAFDAKKYAFAADFIRLYAVYYFGGIYLDMDIEIVKAFDELLDSPIILAYENDKIHTIEAGCFGAEINSVYIKKCLDYYDGRSFCKTDGTFDKRPLPYIMKDMLSENMPIYTSDFFTAKNIRTGTVTVTSNTFAIHHFEGSWQNPEEKKRDLSIQKILNRFGENFFSSILITLLFSLKDRIRERGFLGAISYYWIKLTKL